MTQLPKKSSKLCPYYICNPNKLKIEKKIHYFGLKESPASEAELDHTDLMCAYALVGKYLPNLP